ncbi:MAG: sulfatase [Sedimentisphaerales bacterium]|nr:sulfatase [Sedimentisphaerales bacterium]
MDRRRFLKYGLYGGAASLLPSLFINGCSGKGLFNSPGGRPNVVVILCDTLRPDFLSFNGYPVETSPFLTELSKRSVNFKRAFSTSSWTAPSTASLFTSKYPHRHGVIEGFACFNRRMEVFKKEGKVLVELNRIPSDVVTMPEIFRSIGYSTIGAASNRNIGEEIGFTRGFDKFDLLYQGAGGEPASVLYKRVKGWADDVSPSKPIFLYMHLNDVHAPYDKHLMYYDKPAKKEDEPKAKYLSEVRYLDRYIKKIYRLMNADSNTIFVVLSDHGEEFMDHGGIGHETTLYRELTNVVAMFHAPFLNLKPQNIDTNISLIDVLPTILDLVNFDKTPEMEGLSVKSLLKADQQSKALTDELNDRTIFAHRIVNDPQINLWAAINRHWNMIEFQDGKRVLFDHRTDLPEKHDVFGENPEITGSLIAQLDHFKTHGRRTDIETTPVNMDQELIEQLRTLGYVGD